MIAKFIATLCACAVAAAAAAASPPQTVTAVYQLYRNNLLVADVSDKFRRQGNDYEIESTTSAAGLALFIAKGNITRASKGQITDQGLKPIYYEERNLARDKPRISTVRFDWAEKKAELTYNDEKKEAPLTPGTLDWAALYYQFMIKPPARGATKVTIANGRRVESYDYILAGEASVTVPAGTFRTLHVKRDSPQAERRLELWLAVDRRFIPVRVTFEEGGAVLEQRLVSLTVE